MGAAKAIKKAVKKMPGLGVSEDAADVMFPERWYDRGYDEREEESSRKVGSGLGSMLRKTAKSRLDMMPTEDLGDLLLEAREDGKWGGINTAKEGMFDFLGNTLEERAADYGGFSSLRPWDFGAIEEKIGLPLQGMVDAIKYARKEPSTFELSDPDTVGIFVQPTSLRFWNDPGHVGFLIAENGGNGNAIGYNYGRYTLGDEDDSSINGMTQGRLLKESNPLKRLEGSGGAYYELNVDKAGAQAIHRKQMELEKQDSYDLKGRYLGGERTLNRKEFRQGKWEKYNLLNDNSCIYYTIEAIQAGFPKNSPAYKSLENLQKNRHLKAPFQLDLWLKREGEKYGITKRRVQYQKKTEESENE